mgnify:CR=1 FL=1
MLSRPSLYVSSTAQVVLVQQVAIENIDVVHSISFFQRGRVESGVKELSLFLVDAVGIEPTTSAL